MAPSSLHDKAMFSGFLIGMICGSVWGLLRGPRFRLNLNRTRDQIAGTAVSVRRTLIPVDPIMSSIAEGKEAARQRQIERGQRQ